MSTAGRGQSSVECWSSGSEVVTPVRSVVTTEIVHKLLLTSVVTATCFPRINHCEIITSSVSALSQYALTEEKRFVIVRCIRSTSAKFTEFTPNSAFF